MDIHVPQRLLRTESVYRTMGTSVITGQIGIGFIVKANRVDDATDMQPAGYSAIYVLRGSGIYSDSTGFSAPFTQGSIFQRMSDRRHTVRLDPHSGFTELFVAFPTLLFESMVSIGMIDRARPVLNPGLDLSWVEDLELTQNALRSADDHDLPRLTAHIVARLLDLLGRDRRDRQRDGQDSMIDEACHLLAGNLDERQALAELTARFRLSYERFRKVFRERMGVSPGEYRIRRRIDRAREMLNDERLTIREIAEQLGYSTPFVFSHQFKRMVGLSPEAFRRRR